MAEPVAGETKLKKQRATKVRDVSAEYGKPAWEYSDGSVRGEAGRMLVALETPEPITVDNARSLVQLRVEKYQSAAAEAIRKELQDTGLIPADAKPEQAMAVLAADQAQKLIAADKPHVDQLLDLYEVVGGRLPRGYQQPTQGTGSMASELRSILLAMADAARSVQREVVDGKVVDA
jgi:hypothetical protein